MTLMVNRVRVRFLRKMVGCGKGTEGGVYGKRKEIGFQVGW
jgi:hypothetical protein